MKLWQKRCFCWLFKMTYNVQIHNFLWVHILNLGDEDGLYIISSYSKWDLDWSFLIKYEKGMLGQSWVDFSCKTLIYNFGVLMNYEKSLMNHDKPLIKWWIILQNEMLTKILNFWLSNDHFAPTVDCSAIRVFDCALLCCKSWNLVWGCLTIFVGMWDLIGPLETSFSWSEPKP